MNPLGLGVLVALTVALAACSSSHSSAPIAPIPPPPPSGSNVARATGTLTFTIKPRRGASATRRRPAYVSPSTSYVTLFIDTAASGIRAACTSGVPCSLAWSSTSGTHVFAVEIDDSGSISGGGNVLAEGSASVELTVGSNTLAPITLNGVPAQISFASQTLFAAGSATCTVLPNPLSNCDRVTYGIADADGNYIVLPGIFDDGGIAIGASAGAGVASRTNQTAPDSAGNDYTAVLGCAQGASGTYTALPVLVNASATPELTTTQLATYGLTYPNQTSLQMQNWPAYTCTSGMLPLPRPTITEFPLPIANSLPNGLTAGPDQNIWFTESAETKIGRITPSGSITEFPLTAGSGAVGITAGSDGNLWFTQFSGNTIGRMTPSGSLIGEFPIPSSGSGPTGITAGPDGNLWFTEQNPGKIGVISTTGSFTEFAIPTGRFASPQSITVGPDGALWFTEYGGNKIGRITTGGGITEFTVPTASSAPEIITAGPDGNLWFTEYRAQQIGQITTSGVITEFPIPSGDSPLGITTGADGNIWFTELLGNSIGRLTIPGDVITEFPITAGSSPYGITAGADGNLWFTVENGTASIGKVTL